MRVHGPKSLTRRQVLAGGGLAVVGAGGLTLAGLAGYAWPHPTADSTSAPATPDDTRGVLHFVTRGDLNPPALTIAHRDLQSAGPATDPPYFILAPAGYPLTGPGEPGLMILNRRGNIVWYSPNTAFPASTGSGRMDLKVQSYRGQPVLTWWQGRMISGYGEGQAVIADNSYRTIATVSAGHGLQVDLHEFVISPQDTALITAVPADAGRPVRAGRAEAGDGAVRDRAGDRHRVRPGAVPVGQPGPHPGHRHLPGVCRRDQGGPVRLLPHQLDRDRAGRRAPGLVA